MKKSHVVLTAGFVAILVGVGIAGNYHILRGSSGTNVLPKLSWALSETYVNMDALENLPMIVARSQYPMTLAAIEKTMAKASTGRMLTLEMAKAVFNGQHLYIVKQFIGWEPEEYQYSDHTTYIWRSSVGDGLIEVESDATGLITKNKVSGIRY